MTPQQIRRRLGADGVGALLARFDAGERAPSLGRRFSVSARAVRKLLKDEGRPVIV